jgi:hypothetical protein
MNMEDISSLFVEGPLSRINQLVTCHPVLDKNDIIQLGVRIGNLRSFVASKVYLGPTIVCIHGFFWS